MNNQKIYNSKFTTYDDKRKAHDEALEEFKKWAEPKIIAHLENGRRVLGKANQSRYPDDFITLPSMPWASYRGKFSIEGFNENKIIMKCSNKNSTFTIPFEWLSLSTWDFNKGVRNEINKELLRREITMRDKFASEARALSQKITTVTKGLEQLREQHQKAVKRATR